jgi:D-alanyl-D-alanine endopeptidase (penicillin-binding protein 7)
MPSFFISLTIAAQLLNTSVAHVIEHPAYAVPITDTQQTPPTAWTTVSVTDHGIPAGPQWQMNQPFEAPPDIGARSAVIMDLRSGRILWAKNPDIVTPIASITKLATVLTWQRTAAPGGVDALYTLTPADHTPDGKSAEIPDGEQLTIDQLLHLTLIASYNDSATALAHSTGLSDEAFVEAMNSTAARLQLTQTRFVDPTGLGVDNTSTAIDVARLAATALADTQIAALTRQSDYQSETASGFPIFATTTDHLLTENDLDLIGGKTGYIDEAGYCLALGVHAPVSGQGVIVVVLGSPTDDSRFADARSLTQWTFDHYQWN